MSNGKIIANTPLAVDFWHLRKCPESRLFFLSHMHSDHTVGLTSTWADRPIYCSPVTASLVKVKLRVKEKWIHPLEIGDSHLLPLDDIGKENMTVTLIDANHCPGAVMFLFEGYFGTILYTGDFRYSPSMLRELCLVTNAVIDVLYLDDTNCDPNRSIPSRKQATQQIKEIIRSHPDHIVVLGLYALGKESLLVELAMEFQTWIEVSFDRMETLRVLGLPDVFTTDPGAGRIRVVAQREISFAAMCRWNGEQPTLAIYPTSRPLPLFHPKLHVVPYSDHSSYQELVDFVSGLKPSSLLPIVGNGIPASLSALLPCKRREVLVPESVQRYMRRLPENWSRSSVNPRRQYLRPPAPKGVVFDSPGERPDPDSSSSSSEMDVDSDCGPAESGDEFVFYKSGREPSDTWRLNLVHPIPEEILIAQRVPFSQLSQSNFSPLKILQDVGGGLTPRPRPTEEKEEEEAAARDPRSSDDSSVSEGSFVPLDGLNDLLALSGSFRFSEAQLERLENDILTQAVFPPEDLKPCRPLKSVVSAVSLCPVRKPDVP